MLILSKLAILNFMLCFLFLVWYPRIQLPKSLDLGLLLGVLFGLALLIKDTYAASMAGTLFHCTVSILCSVFTYRYWKRVRNG